MSPLLCGLMLCVPFAGTLAFIATQRLSGATAIALAVAAAIAGVLLAAEWWLVVAWLARRIDRLDLLLERLN